jgi:hypothetical protein
MKVVHTVNIVESMIHKIRLCDVSRYTVWIYNDVHNNVTPERRRIWYKRKDLQINFEKESKWLKKKSKHHYLEKK